MNEPRPLNGTESRESKVLRRRSTMRQNFMYSRGLREDADRLFASRALVNLFLVCKRLLYAAA